MHREVIRITILLFAKFFFFQNAFAQCILVNNATPYKEDFEASYGNWTSGGSYSDWAWGSPTKPTITAAGGGKKCWISGGLTGSFYNNNERSYLMSPCFDFTNLTNPFIQFKIFWETEYQYDGACFEYSLDNGTTWQNVGAVNEPANCLNANWFNCSNIKNMSGLGPNNEGWSGTIQPPNGSCGGSNGSGSWLTASHEISNLAGEPSVTFRFTFGAGYLCNNFDGFAIDDITISNAPPGSVDFVPNCITNLQVGFTNNYSPCLNNYVWNFGDPASGTANTTSASNPTHFFSSPGSYTVLLTAIDPSGSLVTATQQIHVMDVKTTITQPVTCSNNNGAINASVNADPLVTGIAYSWNTTPVSNTASISGLAAGTYIVTATASNACPAKDTVVLIGSVPLTHTISTTNTTCGLANGAISIVESGGSPVYKYSWQPNVSNNATAANLSSNTYIITVTDNVGCKDVITASVSQLSKALTHTVSITNISCTIPTGSAAITESGGTIPFTYLWSPSVSSAAFASGLAEGNYLINIHDSSNCADSVYVQIIDTRTNKVSINNVTNVTCFRGSDGTATAAATGIPPITYNWSPTGGNAATANNLAAGTYTVTATDATGCASTATAEVTQPASFNITINTTPGCKDNTTKAWATVTNGNQPYQYMWSNGSVNDTAINLGQGNISVMVIDAKGCKQSEPAFISPFVPLIIDLGNDTTICPGNVVKLYPGTFASYLWQDNTTSSTYNATQTGTYTVQVVDNNGCDANASIKVTAMCQDILFPNAFTPNGDGRNDGFGPVGTLSAVSAYSLKIFNRFGQAIFASTNPSKKWNGTTKGANGDGDVYVWIAQYSFNGEKRKAVKGSIVLIR